MVSARFYYINLKQCRKNDDTVHFSEYRKTLKSEVGLSLLLYDRENETAESLLFEK